MKTIEEKKVILDKFDLFIQRIKDDEEQFEKDHPIIKLICEESIDIINNQITDPEELASIQLRLTAYNATLGGIVAKLNNYSNVAITYRKLKKSGEYTRLRAEIDQRTSKYRGASDSENISYMEVREDLQRELIFMSRYNKCQQLWDDTNSLIVSIQVYLKQVKREFISSKTGNQ